MHLIKALACSASLAVLASGVIAQELTVIVPSGPDGEALTAAAGRYQAETGKAIEVVQFPYDNVLEKVVSDCSAGSSTFDVVLIDDPWFPLLSEGSCLEELTGYFAAANVSGPDDDFVPNSVRLCQEPYAEGPYYCLPYTGNAQLFFYNPAMMAEAGYTEPMTTWDNVLTGAAAVSEQGRGRTFGFALRGVQGHPIADAFLPIFWSFGGEVFDAEGNVAVNSEAGIAALEFFLKLRDVSPPGVAGFDSEELQNSLTTRTAAAAVFWPGFISRFEDPNSSRVVGELQYSAMPSAATTGKSMIGNWLLGISAQSDSKDEAFAFLSYATSEEQMLEAAAMGNSPVRVSVYENADLVAKPQFRHFPVLLEALNNSEPRPRQPRWPEIVHALGTGLSQALTDAKPPQQALDDAAAEISAIVSR